MDNKKVATPTVASEDTPLCERCQVLDIRKILQEKKVVTLGLRSDFISTLKSDCSLCYLFDRLLPVKENPYRVNTTSVFICPGSIISQRPCQRPNFSGYDNRQVPDVADTFELLLRNENDPPKSEMTNDFTRDRWERMGALLCSSNDRSVPRRMASSGFDLELVKNWLDRCQAIHSHTCSIPQSDVKGPSRLIDVQQRRVVKRPEGSTQYTCLSYVWGDVVQNYAIDTPRLPQLPATIEDAMLATSLLGFNYLWVDSICIDQTDLRDKMSEISKMDVIYQGSSLTLVALNGNSAEAGFPQIRVDKGYKSNQSYVRIGNTEIVDLSPLERQYAESAWSSRAWTYQEGLLSTRCLYFSQDGLYFECNEATSSEDINDIATLHNADIYDFTDKSDIWHLGCGCGIGNNPKSRNKFSLPSEEDTSQRDNAFRAYNDFLESYTSRKTTKESDFLHASRAFLGRLCHTYLASGSISGIPLDLLPEALAFYGGDIMDRRRSFPSWSWTGWKPAEGIPPFMTSFLLDKATYSGHTHNDLEDIELSAIYIGALKTSNHSYYLRLLYSNSKTLSNPSSLSHQENLQSNLLRALRPPQVTISDSSFEKMWNETLVLETTVLHIPPCSSPSHHGTTPSSGNEWMCTVGYVYRNIGFDQWIRENMDEEGLNMLLLYQTVRFSYAILTESSHHSKDSDAGFHHSKDLDTEPHHCKDADAESNHYSESSSLPDLYNEVFFYLLVTQRNHPAKTQNIVQARAEQAWIAERVSAIELRLKSEYLLGLDTILRAAREKVLSYGTAFPMRVALQ